MAAITKTATSRGTAVTLTDGSLCYIRPIQRSDEHIVRGCFHGLSPSARRFRFFGTKQALTEADLAYLTDVDGHDHLALCAVRVNDMGAESEVLGVVRCVRVAPGSETAELAIAVIDAAQGQGVGSALLRCLIAAARDQGVRRLRCDVFAENEGMRRWARRLGGQAHWSGDGTIAYECALPDPDAHSDPLTARSPLVEGAPDATVQAGTGSTSSREAWMRSWERVTAASVAAFEMVSRAWLDGLAHPPVPSS